MVQSHASCGVEKNPMGLWCRLFKCTRAAVKVAEQPNNSVHHGLRNLNGRYSACIQRSVLVYRLIQEFNQSSLKNFVNAASGKTFLQTFPDFFVHCVAVNQRLQLGIKQGRLFFQLNRITAVMRRIAEGMLKNTNHIEAQIHEQVSHLLIVFCDDGREYSKRWFGKGLIDPARIDP